MSYKIELAKESDMIELFDLANDPIVRENSFNQRNISIEEHKKWFKASLQDKNCHFYIIRDYDEFVGSVRFDLRDKEYIISIQISKNFRGRGIGSDIVKIGTLEFLDNVKSSKVFAHIKKNNIISLKVFLRSGYEIINKSIENNFYILEYK